MAKAVFALLWLFVEGTGIPLLSEGAFGALGFAVHGGEIAPLAALGVAMLATVAGNVIGFFAVRAFGSALLDRLGRKWPEFAATRMSVENGVRRHLFVALTVARFVGLGSFGMVLWLSSLTRVRWQFFVSYLLVLDLLWVSAWFYGSRWLVDHLAPFFAGRPWWQDALFCALFAGTLWAAHRLGRHHRSFAPHPQI